MAESAKYAPINGGTLFVDMKAHLLLLKTKRIAYGFVFIFILVTFFLAFSPSPNPSSPWFTNIFTSNKAEHNGVYGSQFSSIFTSFFPRSSHQVLNFTSTNNNIPSEVPRVESGPGSVYADLSRRPPQVFTSNTNFEQPHLDKEVKENDFHDKDGILEHPLNVSVPTNSSVLSNKDSSFLKNQTQSKDFDGKVGALENPLNKSTILDPKVSVNVTKPTNSSTFVKNQNQSRDFDDKVGVLKSNQSTNSASGDKRIEEKEVRRNFTSSLVKKGNEDLVKSLLNCDFFDGNWVKDESYPLYKPGSCSLIDEQFNCVVNGRPDSDYLKMKWKPKACSLPRLNGTRLLELLRGKRLAFVGDSLNRNMWESLICILRNSVKDQKKVYEEFGRHHFRTEASYSFIFEEYNCKVEFFVSPFLVQQWEVADKKGVKKETLRLDLIGETADKYKNADIIVFNTGHWWTHEKTSLGKDYYQEGNHVYNELNVLEAFRKALTTWGRWVDAHINPKKTFVLFRGYSASHFSGGQWNSGGACDSETEPIKNDKYLTPYPSKMTVLENVFKGMKTRVSYLNITRMSDYRKDGHPSIYRKPNLTDKERRSQWRFQDCSHWCLPGVPDAWNELLYAELLVRQHQKQQEDKS